MSRSYDVKAVALSLGVSIKWIDNLLTHNDIPGVVRIRQGVQRRINDDGLLAIELVRRLSDDLGVPLGRAAELLRGGFENRSTDLRLTTPSGITIVFPVADIVRELQQSIADALESAPQIRRGRPPSRHK